MKARLQRWRGWVWWAVPAAALFVLVGFETQWGNQILRLPEQPAALEAKPITPAVLPEYRLADVSTLNETVDRTLFNPTRRPAPPPIATAESGEGAIQRGQFVLTGTTVAGDRSIAFLKEVSSGKARTVRRGEKINGMVVSEVTSDHVNLTLNGDTEELALKVAPGPKGTVPVAPGAAAVAAAAQRPGGGRRAAAAAAAAPTTQDAAAQSVAERRAAARAARAAASGATNDPAAAAANAGANANGANASGATDPWASVYQRMQQNRRTR